MTSIREVLLNQAELGGRFLHGAENSVALIDLLAGSSLSCGQEKLAGRSILLRVRDQLSAALAIIELDGVARRMILCPPDVADVHLPTIVEKADADTIVSDEAVDGVPASLARVRATGSPKAAEKTASASFATEWVLLTSGTTGVPRLVAHSFASLTAPIQSGRYAGYDVVWGTFYDIRRYGGLQIFLRFLLGEGSLVLSSAGEAPGDHLKRLGGHAVTHLTGTPSHWRRAVMSPSPGLIAPRYVRLSGEIADQAILNSLRSFYPRAAVGHAFASTEAGVGFEVNDGLEGFSAGVIGSTGNVDIKVVEQTLRIRSPRTAARYLGEDALTLKDPEGFVDTGDVVDQRSGRYYFLGRKSGVINVGGEKVYPEEVEALLNRHPAVRMSCVRPRRSPITGSLVVAEIVLKEGMGDSDPGSAEVRQDILKLCRETLPRHKVPTSVRFVPSLSVEETGKISRSHA